MSSPPSSAENIEIDLWLARDPQLRAPALLAGFDRVLSAEDRARVSAMRFEAGRHQQLITRAMARLVLSTYLPTIPPADWRFERGEHGRPSVARDLPETARALNFNLAHTTGLVVMAVGRVPLLGVDVERDDRREGMSIARRYFSAVETAALEVLPAGEQAHRFRRLWTLKESWLKAVGTGVSGGLDTGTFHLDDGGLRFERAGDPDAGRWRFREFAIDGGFLVALACQPSNDAANLRVSLREFPATAAG